jgi:hypothetical protein
MKKLEIGAVYKHYKGTKAKVIGEGFHSETEEPMVIYIHLEDGVTWIRPKEMFLGNAIVNREEVERFQKIDQEVLIKPKKN